MSPVEHEPDETPDSVQESEPEWVRRKRLAAVFGDVLPEQTSDDRSAGSRPDAAGGKGDDWYRDQVPPHHG
jgi:hypothetical protein